MKHMAENFWLVSEDFLLQLYKTLKGLDVRGYDSMYSIVASVISIEEILKTQPFNPAALEAAGNGEEHSESAAG